MRKIMKKLLLLNIFLAALSAPAHSATIKVFATDVLTTYGDIPQTYGGFTQTPGGSTQLTNAEISTIIASDPATAIYGSDASKNSPIDLGFGGNTILTGAGADLVIFSLWSGYDYSFGLQAFGTDPAAGPLSSFNYMVTGNSIFETCAITDSTGACTADISAISIDLFGSNNLALDDNIELGYIRLFIGGGYNGTGPDAYSNFTLIGANYTNAAVVPLPLPVILFSSGLALLGWIGRRKKL